MFRQTLRSVVALGVAPFAAGIAWTLMVRFLWLPWSPGAPANPAYEVGTLIAASAFALAVGGLVAGLIGGRARAVHGAVLGLLLGAFLVYYIVGVDRQSIGLLFVVGALAAIPASLGAWAARYVRMPRRTSRTERVAP